MKDGAAWLAVLLLLASMVAGGASRDNALPLAVIEVIAAPLLALSIWGLATSGEWRRHRLALILLALVIAVAGLQLVPVPPDIYRFAPGRAAAFQAFDLAGVQPGWLPLSINPDATRRALLALIPPAAIFLALLRAAPAMQLRLAGAYVVMAILSILLGAVQIASRGGAFTPYDWTPVGSIVAFFANRNHLATLLLAMLPVAAGVIMTLRRRYGERVPAVLLLGGYSLLTLLALAAVRSRFGILGAAPVLVVTLLFAAWAQPRGERPRNTILAGAFAGGLALAVVISFGLGPILTRFEVRGEDARVGIWAQTLRAAAPYAPLGAGPGAFDRVYRSVESPEAVTSSYMNQAHNDYVELWLEAGIPGVILGAIVLAVLARWSWRAWAERRSEGAVLRQAASLGLAVILLHSIVDYPLRTESLAVFAAFLVGVLATLPTERAPPRRANRTRSA